MTIDEDLDQACGGVVSETVVYAVLSRAAQTAAGTCTYAPYVLGQHMRVRADGHVDQVFYAGCAEQVRQFFECDRQSVVSRIRFPPLTTGDCAWIDVPEELREVP